MAAIKFNAYGNPERPLTLSLEEFKNCFGTNDLRKLIINEAQQFLDIFNRFGSRNIYVTGSFITTKENPGDIDLCIDMAGMDCVRLSTEFPQLLTNTGIMQIKEKHKCHIAVIFDSSFMTVEDLKPFNTDRNNNPRPMIKLLLKGSL